MVDTNIKMAHLYQNKTINTLTVSALRSQQDQVELEDSIYITYGILDNIFQIWILNSTMLGNSTEKKSDIVNNVKKSTVNSLASIHFQLCFKYIIPGFTILFVPSNFKPCSGMGLNFHIVHPCQP